MALEELLAPNLRSIFFEQHFLKLPFALAGGCRHVLPLGTREVVERILTQASVDAIASGPDGARKCSLPWSATEVERAIASGESIGIRHAQNCDLELARLAADFVQDFRAPVDIHLYLTPANRSGFGWHYDAEDVFILQTSGSKHWELRKNTVNPWPLIEALPDDMQHEKEIMPVMRCALEAGDWLYIPGGYWHRTSAAIESISLSVGVATRTGIDVFDFLRPRLVDSLRWRQRLIQTVAIESAESNATPSLACHLAELGQDLARMLADPAIAAAFLEYCRQTSQPVAPD